MREPIAIVGMGAAFPGSPDLAAYWRNLVDGFDAIRDIPADRIEPSLAAANGFTCTRGGFLTDFKFDPVAYGIMPVAAATAEPDQLLALAVASAALADTQGAIARDRAAVILGRGGYLNPGMARLADRTRTVHQLAATLHELDLDEETVAKVRAAFLAKTAAKADTESAIGLVPNLAASRIANRLDLRGPAYTIDAACASSLLAVDQACNELVTRRVDIALAGSVHVCHDVTFWSVFTQLGALSKTSQIRPFDRRADGIVIGEGCGIVVLKRLADAERDNDRIYATIVGTGVSSDGRESSAMRPRADGQLAAIRDAWQDLDRDALGLVEAHGTATPTGDEVELSALAQFFGPGAPAALGSVKSMIGHAMPAAGSAGLIKTALALHHGIVPPSLHCAEPNAALASTRFHVPARAEELTQPMAGVSAFGFGGINAHVALKGDGNKYGKYRSGSLRNHTRERDGLQQSFAGASIDEVRARLARREAGGSGDVRLAMLGELTDERIGLANKVLDRGQAWRGKSDIWFSPRGLLLEGSVAFVFPGVEATFAVNAADVAEQIGEPEPPAIRDAVVAAASKDQSSSALELRGYGAFALGRLLARALGTRGIVPAAMAGHSLGEWTGMVVSEMIPRSIADEFVKALPVGTLEVPDVVFAAVGCGAQGANAALEGLPRIAVSHDNCPHQSIICGVKASVTEAMTRLAARGVLCQELPFKSGFHSPLFADYLAMHRKHLGELALEKPIVPLWSATTAAPYPDAMSDVRTLAIRHLVEPVRFRELIEQMYASGVRAFVQLGVGSIGSFVEDTLRGKEHLAISAATAKHTGASQLARVEAALWVEGYAARPVAAKQTGREITLSLGAPLVRLGADAPKISTTSRPDTSDTSDPVIAELVATLDEAAAASRAVVDAYRARATPTELTTTRTLSSTLDPYLLDHCFYRQPPAWPVVSDRYPVVPMTMTIANLIAAAQPLQPGLVPIAVEDVRALRWLAVEPEVTIALHAKLVVPGTVEVDLPGYARATVRFGKTYPSAPAPQLAPLTNARPAPFSAEEMYAGRWMFHGPEYQGVTGLGPLGDDGVDGEITTLPAPGALLDCAGQLMGWWVMHTEDHDRLAMPVHIERIAFFGPHPSAGERVACRVRIREVTEQNVRADLEVGAWAQITGWTDRRFDSDAAVWNILMYPEDNVLAVPDPAGFVTVTEHWRNSSSRELMMRRYLGEAERADHDRTGPRARRGWLLGRIAIKDAARLHHAKKMWPAEIAVSNAPSGQPLVANLHVSVSHKDDRAVAIVDADCAVGIDLERIEPRTESFLAIAFTPAERAYATTDAAYARLWAAKEAVAKALGTGMTDPKRFEAVPHGDDLKIADFVVHTKRDGDYMIAWTKAP